MERGRKRGTGQVGNKEEWEDVDRIKVEEKRFLNPDYCNLDSITERGLLLKEERTSFFQSWRSFLTSNSKTSQCNGN